MTLFNNIIRGTVNVTGPYTFQWYDNLNNLISSNDTADVCAGAYSLIVTDNKLTLMNIANPKK